MKFMADETVLSTELLEVLRVFMQSCLRVKKERPMPMFKPGEADVVAYIHRNSDREKGVNPSRIGEHIGLSRPAVTAILNSLQEKGCIERKLSSSDRRMFEIHLTPESREKVDEMMVSMNAHVKRIVAGLGREDSMELIRLMKRVVEISGFHFCAENAENE